MPHLWQLAAKTRLWTRRWSTFERASAFTVRQLLQDTRKRLVACGRNASEAKVLLANSVRNSLAIQHSNDLFLHLDHTVEPHARESLDLMISRRCRGEPLAYVTGTKEFWSMEFMVTSNVLIPRSDSEVLIESLVQQFDATQPLRILDLGTGSGCLLLAALHEFPNATGIGIDICDKALQVATQNAIRHGLHPRSRFVRADLRKLTDPGNGWCEWSCCAEENDPVLASSSFFESFDVVLCNPPYISRHDLQLVANDVLQYEPSMALFPPKHQPNADHPDDDEEEQDEEEKDPLALEMYKSVNDQLVHWLNPFKTSVVLLEIGTPAQAEAVQQLFAANERLEFVASLTAHQKPRGLLFRAAPVPC